MDGGGSDDVRLNDEQRLDWLRLIRSQNVGSRAPTISRAATA
jgi:hypothetical protein